MNLLDKLQAATPLGVPTMCTEIVDPVKAQASRLTGMKVEEIADVREAREGTVIECVDGVELLVVPVDKPDDDGKTGVMLRRPPDRGRTSMPIYVPRGTRKKHERAQRRAMISERRAAEEAARREAERLAAEPTSARLEMLLQWQQELEAVRNDPSPGADPQRWVAKQNLLAVDQLLKTERAFLHRDDPEPRPEQSIVDLMVDTVQWARGLLNAENARQEAAIIERFPRCSTWRRDVRTLERELASALKFLAHHDLDESGEPLVCDEPEAK